MISPGAHVNGLSVPTGTDTCKLGSKRGSKPLLDWGVCTQGGAGPAVTAQSDGAGDAQRPGSGARRAGREPLEGTRGRTSLGMRLG